MKNILKALVVLILMAAAFVGGKQYAITHLEIETDGYGDSAIVTLDGQSHLYGINGYALDLDGTTCCQME